MSSLLDIILILFLLKLLRDSLFYVWLWQVKEYRIDRMISHLRENVFPLDKGGWGVIIAVVIFISYFIFLKSYLCWLHSSRPEILWGGTVETNCKSCILVPRPFGTMEPAAMAIFTYLVLLFFTISFFQIIKEIKNRSLKRPKPTLKIMLIFFLLTIVYFLIALCWFYSSLKVTSGPLLQLKTSVLLLFIIIVNPLIISSIILAIEPMFYFQKKRIIKRATEKMQGLKKIKVIGITGSYGKTSTKEFLYAILSQKYKVVKTEGNNNTNIGVAYTVLNKVSDEYDYFICEMGAYKIGEIAEICGIVKPEIGILTGVNKQHIDLFGSIKNTVKAKFELIKALPGNGLAVINESIKYQVSSIKVSNIEYFSLENAKNIKVYRDYAEFEYICHCEEHQRRSNPEIMREELNNGIATLPSVARNDSSSVAKFKFNILGKHYIENVLSAIMVAEYLGMSLEEIKTAVEKIEPTEYMMRKIKGLNGSIFIDDSYSANPDGVIAALDYLKEAYPENKKIIIFPGIIELGKERDKIHGMLFNRISEVCDVAYILNTKYSILNTRHKCKFIFEANFDKTANMLKNDLDKNTVVLFESRGAGVVMGKLIKK